MENKSEFSFGNVAIADAYHRVLVPSLFEPWAHQLLQLHKPWQELTVLDLACGTGVVSKALAKEMNGKGKIIGIDLNNEMLQIAIENCQSYKNNISFLQGSADSLLVDTNSIDILLCQQGFQFFQNKSLAASEIYRVLKPNGKAVLTTWLPVAECEIFGALCKTLETLELSNLADLMRIPFDFLTQLELHGSFQGIGFSKTEVEQLSKPLFLSGGNTAAVDFIYATPIGPHLKALPEEMQELVRYLFLSEIKSLIGDDGSIGKMAANVLVAEK